MKNAAKGAKLDKITEMRQFPMDFFCKTFNYSISPIYQQIAIIKNGIYWKKKLAKKLNSPPTSVRPPHYSGAQEPCQPIDAPPPPLLQEPCQPIDNLPRLLLHFLSR
jgi:hypothetical protein